LIARTVLATRLVDYGLGVLRDRFDNLRSKIVLACATDAFYEVYNDLTNDRRKVLRAGAKEFRSDLSHWEKKAISQHFPPPPGTVLVGASGGGREALALARQGYRVVAFDPAGQLVSSLADVCGGLPIESFRGRYAEFPFSASCPHRSSFASAFCRCHPGLGKHLAPSLGPTLSRNPLAIQAAHQRTDPRQLDCNGIGMEEKVFQRLFGILSMLHRGGNSSNGGGSWTSDR
jgi:hypothetical protein